MSPNCPPCQKKLAVCVLMCTSLCVEDEEELIQSLLFLKFKQHRTQILSANILQEKGSDLYNLPLFKDAIRADYLLNMVLFGGEGLSVGVIPRLSARVLLMVP